MHSLDQQTPATAAFFFDRSHGQRSRVAASEHTAARERSRVRGVAAVAAARGAQRVARRLGARATTAHRPPGARN